MLFHTWPFLVFFVVVFAVGRLIRGPKLLAWFLFLASYFFYGFGENDRAIPNWWFIPLLFYSTVIDYGAVELMARSRSARVRKFWLFASLANNLLVLGLFKYAGFFASNLNALAAAVGLSSRVATPDWMLPIGISFFTFQSMSYTIDYYRGVIEREPNFIRFAAFVSLFPQLVAGPIERAGALLPQLRQPRRADWSDVAAGASLFLTGLFKKVALADFLSHYVDQVYAYPQSQGSPALILGTIAFAWQIYFDFSGYTDMARGVAQAMGFRLMQNFRHPYLAVDPSDFWSRWHISLSEWFRDYVYIPLGGGRGPAWRVGIHVMLVFLISGFWHGADWKFIVWGAVHGITAIVFRMLRGREGWEALPKWLRGALLFMIVCLAWVFFRAASMADAAIVLQRIFSGPWEDPRAPLLAYAMIGAVWIYQALLESRWKSRLQSAYVQTPLAVLMLLYLCLFAGADQNAFIYFQF